MIVFKISKSTEPTKRKALRCRAAYIMLMNAQLQECASVNAKPAIQGLSLLQALNLERNYGRSQWLHELGSTQWSDKMRCIWKEIVK